MRFICLLFYLIAAATLRAQSDCPDFNFLTARIVELKPTETTHTDVVRQSDGSYTAFEVADASPHRVLNITTHAEQRFAACLPHPIRPAAGAVPPPGNPPGATSQLHVTTPLPGGNYVVAGISADQSAFDIDVFDAQHILRSEKRFSYSAPESGAPNNRIDFFLSLKLTDINGDGKLDLIAEFSSNRQLGRIDAGVWTFAGNGDGTFAEGKRSVVVQTSTMAVGQYFALGDLNGDGKLDVAIAAPSPLPAPPVKIGFGGGDGTFSNQNPFTGGTASTGPVVLVDLDGDGKVDLVYSNRAPAGTWKLEVAHNLGDGTFAPGGSYSVANASSVAVGDVNGDGLPDLVTASGTILLGDGKGGFPVRRDYAVANRPGAGFGYVSIGDLDGDGIPDLIFGSGDASFLTGDARVGAATFLAGTGKGFFAGAPVLAGTDGAFALADFDYDGNQDVAVASSPDLGSLQLTVVRGAPDGTLIAGPAYQIAKSARYRVVAVAAGDFDHDGNADLAVGGADAAGIDVYAGKGDGTFGPAQTIPVNAGAELRSVIAIDLNKDGLTDIAATTSDSVLVWIANAGSGFASTPSFTLGVATPSIVFGDFNGDRKTDMLVLSQGTSSFMLLPGKGDSTFDSAVVSRLSLPGAAYGLYAPVQVADFDGDGRLDLAVETYEPGSAAPPYLAIAFGQGDGRFGNLRLNLFGMPEPVADFNGDRIPDMVGLKGLGDGAFETITPPLPLRGTPAVADVNRDGSPDILLMTPSGLATFINMTQAPPDLAVTSAASFTGDLLAPGSIAAAFGEHLAGTAMGAGQRTTTLGGITISVKDAAGTVRLAQVFFVSPRQVNFLVPPDTAPGAATITLSGAASGKILTARTQIAPVAPALFTAGQGYAAAYAVRVAPSGTQTILPLFTTPQDAGGSAPIDVSQPGQVYLILYGTGFDAAHVNSVTATVQGVNAPVTFAGPVAGLAGLDQVNVLLPASLAGTGVASVRIFVDGTVSNPGLVRIR